MPPRVWAIYWCPTCRAEIDPFLVQQTDRWAGERFYYHYVEGKRHVPVQRVEPDEPHPGDPVS